jgi:hypothetical protein
MLLANTRQKTGAVYSLQPFAAATTLSLSLRADGDVQLCAGSSPLSPHQVRRLPLKRFLIGSSSRHHQRLIHVRGGALGAAACRHNVDCCAVLLLMCGKDTSPLNLPCTHRCRYFAQQRCDVETGGIRSPPWACPLPWTTYPWVTKQTALLSLCKWTACGLLLLPWTAQRPTCWRRSRYDRLASDLLPACDKATTRTSDLQQHLTNQCSAGPSSFSD